VDVEMQIGNLGNMERRSTYYACRMFGDQNITSGRYQNLNRVIAINVLDFNRIKHIKRYHTKFRLRETQENIDLTDAIEIHFIELPKLKLEMASYIVRAAEKNSIGETGGYGDLTVMVMVGQYL
jgi:predicted transposase/invertase (TIGR01784 family)